MISWIIHHVFSSFHPFHQSCDFEVDHVSLDARWKKTALVIQRKKTVVVGITDGNRHYLGSRVIMICHKNNIKVKL